MATCIARLRETETLISRDVRQRDAFSSPAKNVETRWLDHAINQVGSSKLLDSRLRSPEVPNLLRRNCGIFSLRWMAEHASSRKLQRLAHSCRRGTLEFGTENTDEQLMAILHCTCCAIVSQCRSSCNSRQKDHARVSGFL